MKHKSPLWRWTQLIPALHCCLTGLSIDFDDGKLYWISSGNSTINRCNLDGTGLEIIDSVKGKLTRATALTIMGDYFFSSFTSNFILLLFFWCLENQLYVICLFRGQAVVGESGHRPSRHLRQEGWRQLAGS